MKKIIEKYSTKDRLGQVEDELDEGCLTPRVNTIQPRGEYDTAPLVTERTKVTIDKKKTEKRKKGTKESLEVPQESKMSSEYSSAQLKTEGTKLSIEKKKKIERRR